MDRHVLNDDRIELHRPEHVPERRPIVVGEHSGTSSSGAELCSSSEASGHLYLVGLLDLVFTAVPVHGYVFLKGRSNRA